MGIIILNLYIAGDVEDQKYYYFPKGPWQSQNFNEDLYDPKV